MNGIGRLTTIVNVPVVIEPKEFSPTRNRSTPVSVQVVNALPLTDVQHSSPVQPAVHPLQHAVGKDINTHHGHLTGPNIEGSPYEMTIPEAHKMALSQPAIKGFCYQNTGTSELDKVWVYFKASFDFHPSESWTSVQVLKHSEMQRLDESQLGATLLPGSHTRDRLVRFYQEYCPEKLPSVVMTLNEYKAMEESLFSSLVRMHGPEPPCIPLDADLPPEWKCVENSVGYIFYVHNNGGRQWKKPRAGDPPPNADPLLLPDQAPSPHGVPMSPSPRRRVTSPRWRTQPVKRAVLVNTGGNPTKFSQYLGKLGFKQQLMLTPACQDSIPTKSNILRAVGWLTQNTSEGDSLFFYFCGETTNDELLSHDDQSLSGKEVAEAMEQGNVHGAKAVFLLDVVPGAKVFNLPYRVINIGPRATIINTPKDALKMPCEVFVVHVLEGRPSKGDFTQAFMNTVHNTRCRYDELLERIREGMVQSSGCVLSIACMEASTGYFSVSRSGEQNHADDTLQYITSPTRPQEGSLHYLRSPSYAAAHSHLMISPTRKAQVHQSLVQKELAKLLGP
eukprot:TRINITY_DN4966_c0_g7_i1.p2 TRINITY_DN4966_c0_g7~~TRINITY_DN4966_c0_g7_i1.p2  ORF type:complete len:561 (+),score=89.40 TRINITY_DN4966_c0_g7_i1:2338-4020(+)